jgi:mono/diheme cytochrome c family protein
MVPGHMVGLIIIVVVICAVSGAIAYGAWKGSFRGLGDALQTSSRSGSRILNSGLAMVFICGIIVVPAVFIIGNRDNSDAQVGGIKMNAAEQAGRELFGEHCAVCHTLAADNAVGKTGPNLDVLKPPKSLVLHTIANGCLQKLVGKNYNSICLAYGNMPADIVEGRQAQDIAAFVARVAGHT